MERGWMLEFEMSQRTFLPLQFAALATANGKTVKHQTVKLRSPESTHHHPETDDAVAAVRIDPVAASRPAVQGSVAPGTATQHTAGAMCRTLRIFGRRLRVVAVVPPILAPLPHVAV